MNGRHDPGVSASLDVCDCALTKQWSRRGETSALFICLIPPRGSLLPLGLKGSMIELECRQVTFYSQHDEACFFAWAEAIPAISSVSGRGQSVLLTVKSKSISDRSLRELLALFQRYKISMRQLAQFRSLKNQAWFAVPDKFWSKSVFAGPTSRSTRSHAKTRAPG